MHHQLNEACFESCRAYHASQSLFHFNVLRQGATRFIPVPLLDLAETGVPKPDGIGLAGVALGFFKNIVTGDFRDFMCGLPALGRHDPDHLPDAVAGLFAKPRLSRSHAPGLGRVEAQQP